jgi:hypothetical protein
MTTNINRGHNGAKRRRLPQTPTRPEARNGPVTSFTVDRRLWRYACQVIYGQDLHIEPINATTVIVANGAKRHGR